MKNINLFSAHDFLIEVDKTRFLLNKHNHIELNGITQKDILVLAYPIEQPRLSIPFCINLKAGKSLTCNNYNVQIFELKTRYDVFISPFLVSSVICFHNHTHTIKNVRHTISAYEDRVKVTNKNGEFVYEVCANSFSSYIYNNYILILCKNNNIKHLLVFNTTNSTFFEISGNQIEIEDGKVKSLTTLNNSLKNVKVCTFVLGEEIKKENEELFEEAPKTSCCPSLVPYKFFEALKTKNFTLAKTFLTPALDQTLTNNKLESYFKNFKQFRLTTISPLTYTLYYENTATDFLIKLNGSLIEEIDDNL